MGNTNNATNNPDLNQEIAMLPTDPLPLASDGPSAYGALPLMSEAIEMQHIQHLGKRIFNEYDSANTAAAFAPNHHHDTQFLQKLSDHDMVTGGGVDAAENHHLLSRQGRLDALKFIDEQAAVKSAAAALVHHDQQQQQNAY